MDKLGENSGWLVLFDDYAAKPWAEKIYMRKEIMQGKEITILPGCLGKSREETEVSDLAVFSPDCYTIIQGETYAAGKNHDS